MNAGHFRVPLREVPGASSPKKFEISSPRKHYLHYPVEGWNKFLGPVK